MLDLFVVVAAGIALIVFFYSGTFFNWPGVKGVYLTFATWFQTGKNGNGHEKPFNYWLKLMLRYETPVLIGLIYCIFCQTIKNLNLRYLAIYGVGLSSPIALLVTRHPGALSILPGRSCSCSAPPFLPYLPSIE